MLKRLLPLLIIFGGVTSLTAQDEPTPTPTPTPDVPGYILGWGESLLYPSALRLDLTIGRPAEQIQSLILTLDVEGRELEIIEVDVEETAIRSGEFVELVYLYEFTPANVPPFLSEMEYAWLVSLVDDEEQVEVPGALHFADPRFEWDEVIDDNTGITLIYPSDRIQSEDIFEDLSLVYDLLREATGGQGDFNFALFPEQDGRNPCMPNDDDELVITDAITETEIVCSDEVIMRSISARDATLVDVDSNDPTGTLRQFLDQMISAFYDDLWDNTAVPQWFRQGLFDFYLPRTSFGDFDVLRTAARNNRLVAPDQLAEIEPGLQQAQVNGMVIYMTYRIGVDGLFDFANAAGETESFEALYEEAFGEPLSSLIPGMSNWLFTSAAESAFLYTPYLPTTATPTPTESLTPFPPTPTHTPTATATVTPTASVTGVLSATPLPTLTETLTNTPRPPSVTPRPAGSFVDPTATPLPSQSTPESDDTAQIRQIGLLVAVGGGLLFIIALLVSYIRGRTKST